MSLAAIQLEADRVARIEEENVRLRADEQLLRLEVAEQDKAIAEWRAYFEQAESLTRKTGDHNVRLRRLLDNSDQFIDQILNSLPQLEDSNAYVAWKAAREAKHLCTHKLIEIPGGPNAWADCECGKFYSPEQEGEEWQAFTCPECGGNFFGSTLNTDPPRVYCHGGPAADGCGWSGNYGDHVRQNQEGGG